MTATLTPVQRTRVGLKCEMYEVSCDNPACTWIPTEFRNVRMAETIRANHVCREES